MLTVPQINLSRGTSCPLPLQRQEDAGGEEEPQGVGGTCVFSRAVAQLGCICMCCAVLRHHAFRCHLPFLTHVAISLSSAPTTCPLEASSCARGAPRCKLCTPCPTSCFAREAGLRSCCSGCEVAFLVKNLGLALILASLHALALRIVARSTHLTANRRHISPNTTQTPEATNAWCNSLLSSGRGKAQAAYARPALTRAPAYRRMRST